MLLSSSSDDIPIEEIVAQAKRADSPGSDSPVPDWISQYHSPSAAQAPRKTSSGDSDDLKILDSKPEKTHEGDNVEAIPLQSTAEKPAEGVADDKPVKSKRKGQTALGNASPLRPGTKGKQKAAVVPTVAATLQKSGIQPAAPSAAVPESDATQGEAAAKAAKGRMRCLSACMRSQTHQKCQALLARPPC